jgi:hypothetical protein
VQLELNPDEFLPYYNIILIVSKFVGKPLLLRMLLAGKQSTLLRNH